MDPVADQTKPDHISFAPSISAHPGTTEASATTSTTTVATPPTTGNHVAQAMNGGGSGEMTPRPLSNTGGKSASGRPSSLAQKESSQYQLVFGIDDTSSETSLTDSPLHDLSNQSNRILHHFPLPQQQDASPETSQVDKECEQSTVTNANPGSMCVLGEAENASDSGVDAGASNPFNPPSVLEDSTDDATPIKGAELQEDSTGRDSKAISNGNLSESSPGKDLDETLLSPEREVSKSQSPDPKSKEPDQLSDLRSRSTSSEEVGQQQKTHPLSFLTSDSELGETPTPPPAPSYSPIPNTSETSLPLNK